MSIYKDGKLIAGGRQCMPLLSFMWSDHVLNDASWLRADTFSWQNGSVYQAVYQHLVEDYDNGPLESETINGQLICFHRAPDGHKVVIVYDDDTHHKAVETIYNSTGVAWYYILDTTNQRFKLPRTKFGFTGLRSGVGGFVGAGLPNITGDITSGLSNNVSGMQSFDASGAFQVTATAWTQYFERWGDRTGASTINLNASRSSSIYGNSDTVQPKATEMYLYFYVGNFTQTALENTAGVVTEDFNELNAHKVIAFQEPTAGNNYTWYRKYADGWVEQGGIVSNTGSEIRTISFPITMANSNYQVIGNVKNSTAPTYCYTLQPRTLTTTNMTAYCAYTNYGDSGSAGEDFYWQVSGMAA